MTWKYGLKEDKDGFLELCEIYDNESYTETSIVIGSEDYQEVLDTLRLIIKDLEDPKIIKVKDNQ